LAGNEISAVLASNILYFHALYILSARPYDSSVKSVCGIGGGYPKGTHSI